MAFADPQSITIDSVTSSLPRVSTSGRSSEYASADGLIVLKASTSLGKRNRHVLRVDHSKIAADPFIPDTNRKVSMSNYIVFDLPDVGYTDAEAIKVYQGFKTLFTASTDALITKLLGGES